ncbi:MAG: pseudouridine synthase, partial [Clostridia bacterium]|nr:pseudouridine synthase [Clostridia bacterium]
AATIKRITAEDGKPSITHYQVLMSDGGRSLFLLGLETGRTHQIRVHLSSTGCPVCGDFLYGT